MFDKNKKRSALIGIASFLLLTGLLLWFLRHLDQDIFAVLADTSGWMLVLLLTMSCLYYLLDAILFVAVLRDQAPRFSLWDGVELTYLGLFGKTALITGGALPLQAIYLHKKGIMVGSSLGIHTVLSIIQKMAVVLYALVLLLFHWRWVRSVTPGVRIILAVSLTVCTLIILALLLLCTSRRVCGLAYRLLDKLPQSGKWPQRKLRWHDQIATLYQQTQTLFQTKEKFFQILLLDFVKLFVQFCIPYAVLGELGLHPYTFLQCQTLAALTLMLASSIPNIAGMGSAELAFMLVFSQSLGDYTAATVVYYRCATYYFPFILSIFMVFFIQKRLARKKT